jgi:hypothetical protein
MNTKTISADTSSGMAAELLRDIQQRNYGVAETKARQLWHRLNEEAHEQRRAEEAARQRNTKSKPSCTTCVNEHISVRDLPCSDCGRYEHYKMREEPDIFLQEMDDRISNLNQAQKMQHSELGQGMRTGFMYARAIYKGTRK